MQKWEYFSKEELEQFVKESNTLKQLGIKCGYSFSNGVKPMRKMIKMYNFDISHFSIGTHKDLVGKRFGKLIVLEKTDKKIHTYYLWKCQCDCGNICYVSTNNLTMGHTMSCGCLAHKSKGEFKISSLLKENGIPFETEKIFDDCYSKSNHGKMRFDFYVNNQYLIEFDGRQHFINANSGWYEDLEDIKQRDEFKNNYCKEHNIPLIRIPYIHLKELCIEDLKLETSKFIV